MKWIRKIIPVLIFIFLTGSVAAQRTNGLFLNDSLSFNGYTLFAPINYTHTYLIDNCGLKVNEWESAYKPGLSAYLLENGNLLRTIRVAGTVFVSGGSGGGMEIHDWNGNLKWRYLYSENFVDHQHHDVEYLPNGNILLIAWEYMTMEEAIEAGRDSSLLSTSFWPDKIVEIKPIGTDSMETIWEWHAIDHTIQDFDSTKNNYGVVAEHPELIDINYYTTLNPDWLHTNGVDYNPELDQIILSVRNHSELWVIDHSTTTAEAAGHTDGKSGKGGDILYRWGNPQTYDRGTSDDRVFYAQHDANWIPKGLPNAGKIMVFNNGRGMSFNMFSAINRIDPPVDASGDYTLEQGAAFGPDGLDWSYQTGVSFYSPNISGSQYLPNGNTLICEGSKGHFFEVNEIGQKLWQYISPVSFGGPVSQGTMMTGQNAVFRAYRYAPDYPAFTDKDLSPDNPVELNSIASDCEIYDDLVSIDEVEINQNIKIYPNPVSDLLKVENSLGESLYVSLINVTGRLVFQNNFHIDQFYININDYSEGMYLLQLYSDEGVFLMNKKILIVR